MNVTSRSDVGLMTVSPRLDASGVPVGLGDVPKAGQSIGKRPDRDRFGDALPRRDGAEMPVCMMAVAKDRWMTVSPHRDGTGVPVGWVAVPKDGRSIGKRPV